MDDDELSDQEIASALIERIKSSPDGWTLLLVDDEPHRVHVASDGVLRFVGNPIVRKLLDLSTYMSSTGGWLPVPPGAKRYSLNEIARDHDSGYTLRDRRRLAIEIGYSLSGFCELSYNHDDEEEGQVGVRFALPRTPPPSLGEREG